MTVTLVQQGQSEGPAIEKGNGLLMQQCPGDSPESRLTGPCSMVGVSGPDVSVVNSWICWKLRFFDPGMGARCLVEPFCLVVDDDFLHLVDGER